MASWAEVYDQGRRDLRHRRAAGRRARAGEGKLGRGRTRQIRGQARATEQGRGVNGAGPDFVVLTGFLGSGKTTLLRDFLTGPEAADTAVIVIEAGEIGRDGVILREEGGDTPIAMLSNGCICCQAGSDLAYTIDRLLATER